jgi:hypothetical protein
MKTGMVLLGALIVTYAVAFVSGREPNPVPANGVQDYGCAVITVNMPTRARPVGMVRIPSPAATFLEIGLWARDRWHRFWAEPLDPQDCVWSADSPER